MPAPPSKPKFTGGRYGSRQYDPNNRSLQAWFSGTGAWHPQNQGPKYTPQYQSIQPFKREVGQVMTPQTGPSQLSMSADSARDRRSHQSMLLPSISGFAPNQIPQGDPPVANPFERRVPRPQTITAGSPMTQPLNQQGSRLFPRPNQQNAQTSFRAPTSYNVLPPINPAMRQQARQWAGQPMPPNVQPPETPYATPPVNYQRAPGGQMAGPSTQTNPLARLMGNAPQAVGGYASAPPAPRAQPQMMPQTNVTANPIRQMLRPQDNPSDYDAFRQFNETGVQPNTTYSASGMENFNPMNKLPQARSREEILSRTNMRGLGSTQTLQQAADATEAGTFNQDGRFFQGAGLGVNPNGSAYFRDRPQATDFAGNAQTAQEAGANRLRGLQQLEQRGVGYVDPNTGAFIGRGARTFASDGPGMNAFAGRLAAGGVTPTDLSAGQLNDNRVAMLGRMAGQRERAMARVQSLAQQSTADRRERMNPNPLQRMLANNPQAALAFQAQQQQQAGAERLARLQNEGRMGVAQLEAGGQQQRNQIGGLAALVEAGVPIADARAQLGMPALPGAQGQGQGLAGNQNKPVFFGGKATPAQTKEVQELKKTGTPQQVADYFENVVGLTGQELDDAINELYGSSFRTAQDPSWWGATGRAIGGLFVPEQRRGRGAGQ